MFVVQKLDTKLRLKNENKLHATRDIIFLCDVFMSSFTSQRNLILDLEFCFIFLFHYTNSKHRLIHSSAGIQEKRNLMDYVARTDEVYSTSNTFLIEK
jgi:hypothetical protein